MNTGMIIFLVAAALFVVWVATSKNSFAQTLRALFLGAQARAANALDDAMNRVAAAEADVNGKLSKARQALVEVKTMRVSIQRQLQASESASTKWQAAAENAARQGRSDLVKEALNRKADATSGKDGLQSQLNFLLGKETEVQQAVKTLEARKALLKKQKVEIKTRAKTAETTLSVNELLAGVDLDGNSDDVARAYELVEEVEAKAGAMAEMADEATAQQRMDEELENLSRPQVDVDAQVEALMAQFGPSATK